MLEDLQEILNYFPIESVDFNAGSGDQYLQDLSKVIEDNYSNGNYQVAFFYTHLLFMSYVYYSIDRAYKISPDRVRDVYYPINSYNGRNDKPIVGAYPSIYELSKIPEKEIFKVFYALDLSDEYIKSISRYVSSRDDFAHATGKGNISENQLNDEVRGILRNMQSVENIFQGYVTGIYKKFLLKNYHLKYKDLAAVLGDFIYEQPLSVADLKFMCNLGISGFRDESEEIRENFRHIKNLHCAFYAYCIENYNFVSNECYDEWTKKDYYLDYLYKDEAKSFIEDILNINKYECVKDGGEFPLYECPNCDEKQLVYIEKEGIYKCFHCGFQREKKELIHCSECGKLFETENEDICHDCWKRKIEED